MGEFIISTLLPFFLTTLLGVLVITLLFVVPRAIRAFFHFPLLVQIILICSIAIGAYIRFGLVPSQQRILFDEDRYMSYAVTYAKFGKAVSIDLASTQKPIIGKPDQAVRSTVPVINGIVLKLNNYSENALHITAKVFSVASILILFIFCMLVFGRYKVALIAALLMTLFPVTAYWSPSTGLDSYFMFFGLLTMTTAASYAKRHTLLDILLFSTSLFLFLCVRVEALLLLPLAVGLILAIRKGEGNRLFQKADRTLVAIIAPLILFRIFISISVIGQKWCCAEALPLEAFRVTYTIRHLLPNVIDLFGRPEIPFVLTIFAAITAALAFSKRDFRVHMLTLWFLIYFVLYSSYYAGRFFSYEFSGSYGRFFLMLTPPFLILVALSIENLLRELIKATIPRKLWLSVLVAALIASFYPTAKLYPSLISISPFYHVVEKQPHELRKFLKHEMLPNIPKNSVVIHNLTALLLLYNHDAVFFGSFLDQPQVVEYVVNSLKMSKEVYSIEAPQCMIFEKRCLLPAKYLVFERLDPLATPSSKIEYVKVRLKTSQDSSKLLYQE